MGAFNCTLIFLIFLAKKETFGAQFPVGYCCFMLGKHVYKHKMLYLFLMLLYEMDTYLVLNLLV